MLEAKSRRNRAITQGECAYCGHALDMESDTGDLHCYHCKRYWRFMGKLNQKVEAKDEH